MKDCVNINPENLNINGYSRDYINYIDISSIDNSTFLIKNIKQINISNLPSRARRIVKRNDIIISTVRPYLKAFSKILLKHDNYICSTGFAVLRVKRELDYEYLFQYVLSQKFVNYMISQMVGSSYPAVNMSDVKVAPVIVPPLEEQQKIASILSNVDDIIIETQNVIENLKLIKKGLMQHLFTQGIGHTEFKEMKWGKIPKEWDIQKLSKVVVEGDGLKRGPWGGSVKKEYFVKTGYKIYEQKCVIKNDFSLGNYYIDEEKFQELKQFEIESGDLLMTAAGTLGVIAIVPNGIEQGIYNQAIIRIRLNEDILNKLFFKYFLKSDFLNKLIKRFTFGSAIKNFASIKILSSVQIPIPPLNEQERIIQIFKSIDDKIENEKYYDNKLKIIKNGLMQDLLTGKVRVIL